MFMYIYRIIWLSNIYIYIYIYICMYLLRIQVVEFCGSYWCHSNQCLYHIQLDFTGYGKSIFCLHNI